MSMMKIIKLNWNGYNEINYVQTLKSHKLTHQQKIRIPYIICSYALLQTIHKFALPLLFSINSPFYAITTSSQT